MKGSQNLTIHQHSVKLRIFTYPPVLTFVLVVSFDDLNKPERGLQDDATALGLVLSDKTFGPRAIIWTKCQG